MTIQLVALRFNNTIINNKEVNCMSTNITIKDVAKQAGVSEATVSRALNDSPQVKRDTRQKIQNIARNLGYRPNGLARSIRVQKSHTLGMIIPDILNGFFTQLSRAIEDTASQAGYDVLIVNTDEHLNKEAKAINLMLEKQVDGLIITSAGNSTDYPKMLGNTPAVFVDRMPPADVVSQYDRVLVDNAQGTQAIINCLINRGAQRIGIINSSVSATARERLQGYHQALAEAGLPADPAIEVSARTDGSNVPQMTRQLLVNQKCDALFAADNTIMTGVLTKLPELQLPAFQLGAFDDNDWFDFLPQPIVTAKQPIAELGRIAVERILARAADHQLPTQEFRLPAEIIPRPDNAR